MSTNKLSHLKKGEKIYLEVTRVFATGDDTNSMCFETNRINSVWVNDDDIFFFPEELKILTNDGMPKQEITVDGSLGDRWSKVNFKGTLKILPEKGDLINGKEVVHSEISTFVRNQWGGITVEKSYTYPPKKTELTLAQVEEKLGLEKDSLIIK